MNSKAEAVIPIYRTSTYQFVCIYNHDKSQEKETGTVAVSIYNPPAWFLLYLCIKFKSSKASLILSWKR